MNNPTHERLRSFVERIERLDEEIKELNDAKKDLYAEAKGTGFDVPTLKWCVAERRKESADRDERDAIREMYWAALTGTECAPTRAPAREAAE